VRRLVALMLVFAFPSAGVAASAPAVALKAWIVIDARDGQLFASYHAHEQLPIASLTKLMTIYLALRQHAQSRSFTVPVAATLIGQSSIHLRAGETVSGATLLEAMLVPSANDAAETMAVGLAGSEQAFVAEMNRAARRLGMRDTAYQTPYGLDTPGQYSTAADELVVARLVWRSPIVRDFARERSMTFHGATFRAVNTLLGHPGVDGLKTGHTGGAGWCLVATGLENNHRLFVVGLGGATETIRNESIAALLDWGFQQFRGVTVLRRGQLLGRLPVPFSTTTIAVVAGRAITVMLRPRDHVRLVERLPSYLTPPLRGGTAIGGVVAFVNRTPVAAAPVVVAASISSASIADRLRWAWRGIDPFR
jgi:serine-type D-Ala-D-Ala carboxypeptidase (penicillin-binding protein 5/6)